VRSVVVLASVVGLAACSGEIDGTIRTADGDAAVVVSDRGALDGAIDPARQRQPDAGAERARDASVVRRDGGAAHVGADAGAHDGGVMDAAPGAFDRDANVELDAGISDGPAEVRFIGRVDRSDAQGPRFAWSGTGLVARFMGTSISVDLAGGQEFSVLIDGALQPKLVPESGATPIASGLSAGPHRIEIYRRTEANQGESQFRGFTFDASGMLLAPPLPSPRRLEVIGDSITCGYGDEGADQTCGFTPQTENHYLSYGAVAARSVGAELSTIAWSGLGVVCNYGDGAQSCVDPFPTYYDRTLPNRQDSQWDFSLFQPQAVILNLGTNDFSTDQDPSVTDFENAYRDFLLHLRSKYPHALILCTCGPMLYGSELDMVRGYIDAAVAATGDDNIGTFDIPAQDAADGLGCNYHPSVKTHQKMADLVVAELQARLGW
jgi:lysophospholipase L1-like esterase